MIEGDDVIVIADADGNGTGSVGTQEKPVIVDTASGNSGEGTLEASGTEVYVKEKSGDLVIDSVTATEGDAEITAPGSVTDNDGGSALDDAAEAQKEADDLDNIAAAAEAHAGVLDEHAKELEAEADKAEKEAGDAREEADKAAEEADKADEKVEEISTRKSKVLQPFLT